jgi:hypothetical protein
MTLEGLLSFGAGIIDARRLWYKSTASAKPVAGGIAILKASVLTEVIFLGQSHEEDCHQRCQY